MKRLAYTLVLCIVLALARISPVAAGDFLVEDSVDVPILHEFGPNMGADSNRTVEHHRVPLNLGRLAARSDRGHGRRLRSRTFRFPSRRRAVARLDGIGVAGFGNVVTESSRGILVGGVANVSGDDAHGIAIGGLANIAGDDAIGVQASLLANVVGKDAGGIRVTGLADVVGRNSRGIDAAGLTCVVGDDMTGIQIGGLASVAGGDLDGIQISVLGERREGRDTRIPDRRPHQCRGRSGDRTAGRCVELRFGRGGTGRRWAYSIAPIPR